MLKYWNFSYNYVIRGASSPRIRLSCRRPRSRSSWSNPKTFLLFTKKWTNNRYLRQTKWNLVRFGSSWRSSSGLSIANITISRFATDANFISLTFQVGHFGSDGCYGRWISKIGNDTVSSRVVLEATVWTAFVLISTSVLGHFDVPLSSCRSGGRNLEGRGLTLIGWGIQNH